METTTPIVEVEKQNILKRFFKYVKREKELPSQDPMSTLGTKLEQLNGSMITTNDNIKNVVLETVKEVMATMKEVDQPFETRSVQFTLNVFAGIVKHSQDKVDDALKEVRLILQEVFAHIKKDEAHKKKGRDKMFYYGIIITINLVAMLCLILWRVFLTQIFGFPPPF